MKRLCVFYRLARLWQSHEIEWIVCKACQQKIRRGLLNNLMAKATAEGCYVPPPHI